MINFCEKIRAKHKTLCSVPDGKLVFGLYKNTHEINAEEWNSVIGGQHFFLQLNYLSLVEKLHSPAIYFRYIIVYKNKVPVFVTYFQINDFTADVFGDLLDSQFASVQSKRKRLFAHYLDHQKTNVVMRLLTCGNNFISGENGMAFKDLTAAEAFDVLEKVVDVIGREEKLRGKISATLIKDFYSTTLTKHKGLDEEKFTSFSVEPNMIVDIPEGIKSLNEYIALFSKKYRNRAKGIFKAAATIVRKELSEQEVEQYDKEIYQLYEQVYEHAKFKLVKLGARYFTETKKTFSQQFSVHGFFLNNKLIAFDSGFLPGNNTVEAHFIGFDYKLNKDFELYQNILYSYIDCALQNNCKHINLGRTASEIKSTVGAKAQDLTCYVRPQNTVSKMALSPLVSFLQPTEWVPRNPFKED